MVDGLRCQAMCQQAVDPPDRPLLELYFDFKWAIGILDEDIHFVDLWIYGFMVGRKREGEFVTLSWWLK